MILTCPNCSTQFLVDASKIPTDGRQVRCASCKHQWHAYADGGAAELKPLEPEPIDGTSQEASPNLIAYPDPEPDISEDETDFEGDTDARPEDAFRGDADFITDEPEELPRKEPELVSSNSDILYDDAPLSAGDLTEKPVRLKPLVAIAAALLVAVLITSFFALPRAMQGPFGFVYAMFGAHDTQGLVLRELRLRERPARSKARYTLEGSIMNESAVVRYVPTLRVAMLDHNGEILSSREYEDPSQPVIEPGKSYPIKAANLETAFKDRLAYFVVDIGNGAQLRLRKPANDLPAGSDG